MEKQKQKLIIGIDYTNEYCQICYFSHRHQKPQSVVTGAAMARYSFPACLGYDEEKETWLIGEAAQRSAAANGTLLYKNLLSGLTNGEKCTINGRQCGYDQLLAVYFGKLIELTQISSGLMGIENITVSLRKTGLEIKKAMGGVFKLLKIPAEKVRVISGAESFAYYVLNEKSELWRDGAMLFDFGRDGFFVKQLTLSGTRKEPLFYVNEHSFSLEFSVRDLGSSLIRSDYDQRIGEVYESLKLEGENTSVYFTGEGFADLWFTDTLGKISKDNRVFRGNNIYVRGACLAGLIRSRSEGRDYPIICKGRTRASVSVVAGEALKSEEVEISGAAVDWYDASGSAIFTLSGAKNATIAVTSIISHQKSMIDFDLSSFPDRTEGMVRVVVSVKYLNESECEIRMSDAGFGEFFEPTGAEVIKKLNLEGYI